MRPVDDLRDARHLELERSPEDARTRRDVGAEEADVEPLEAAQRAESLPLPARLGDGGAPVHGDAERIGRDPERMAARGERDRDAHEGVRPPLQQGPRLVGGEPADVDAGDPDACGDVGGRAGKEEADRAREHDQETGGDRGQPERRGHPPATSGGTNAHGPGGGRQAPQSSHT